MLNGLLASVGGCYMDGCDYFFFQIKQKRLQFWKSSEWRRKDTWLGNGKLNLSLTWLKGCDIVVAKVRFD